MKKKKLLIPFVVFLILLSCTKNPTIKSEKLSTSVQEVKSSTDFGKPESVALNFYNWYLKDIYLKKSVESPEVVLNDDSVYVLDPQVHIDFLNNSGYFSSKFYENELDLFNKCNKILSTVDPRIVDEDGGFPSDYIDDNDCLFMSCMIWTLGQGENLNTAKIKSTRTFKDSASVIVTIGDSIGGDFSYSHVTLLKEADKWKISRIKVQFK